MAKKSKSKTESSKPLEQYLKKDGVLVPKLIRAKVELWQRAEDLAACRGVSLNRLVCAALEKTCDEGGL